MNRRMFRNFEDRASFTYAILLAAFASDSVAIFLMAVGISTSSVNFLAMACTNSDLCFCILSRLLRVFFFFIALPMVLTTRANVESDM